MKRKPMKREAAYVVAYHSNRERASGLCTRSKARRLARLWGADAFYVQPVDIIPAKGRRG